MKPKTAGIDGETFGRIFGNGAWEDTFSEIIEKALGDLDSPTFSDEDNPGEWQDYIEGKDTADGEAAKILAFIEVTE